MAVSILPALLSALVTNSRAALSDVNVTDGIALSDDPGDFLMVGLRDPFTLEASTVASARQEPATMGTTRTRDERGEVWLVAVSRTGDTDMSVCRGRVFALAAAVENLVRTASPPGVATPILGVTGLISLDVTDFALDQAQDDNGAWAILAFSLTYRARI